MDKYKHPANPERAKGMHEIARSGKSGGHDSRPKRERSRNAVKRAEVKRGE